MVVRPSPGPSARSAGTGAQSLPRIRPRPAKPACSRPCWADCDEGHTTILGCKRCCKRRCNRPFQNLFPIGPGLPAPTRKEHCMSVSAAAPVIHPLPVLQACRYECCRPAAADLSLHGAHGQPGLCPEADAVPPAPYPSLKDPFVATGMRCPSAEPLEELVASRRRLGWVPDFDATEAAVAAALECEACRG